MKVNSAPQGLKLYQQWTKKTGGDQNENSYVGWMNADLFVTGPRTLLPPDEPRDNLCELGDSSTYGGVRIATCRGR